MLPVGTTGPKPVLPGSRRNTPAGFLCYSVFTHSFTHSHTAECLPHAALTGPWGCTGDRDTIPTVEGLLTRYLQGREGHWFQGLCSLDSPPPPPPDTLIPNPLSLCPH